MRSKFYRNKYLKHHFFKDTIVFFNFTKHIIYILETKKED